MRFCFHFSDLSCWNSSKSRRLSSSLTPRPVITPNFRRHRSNARVSEETVESVTGENDEGFLEVSVIEILEATCRCQNLGSHPWHSWWLNLSYFQGLYAGWRKLQCLTRLAVIVA